MKKMDFSQTETKPEVIKNLPKTFPPERHVVDRNKQDLLAFFNISPKTRVAVTVSAFGILLFFFSIFTGAFQNQQFNTLYPKDESSASQYRMHSPIEGPGLSLIGQEAVKINQPFEIKVDANTGTESATIIIAQVKFDPSFFEVQAILTDDSIVPDWIDNNVSNTDGIISLVGSFPKGIIAKKGDNIARILFVPKKIGQSVVYVVPENSHMYRLVSKTAIQISHDQIPIDISE
jgi:hypothetical protein